MKYILIQFCRQLENLIFVVEANSGVKISVKTGLKELNNMTSRRMHPHADMYHNIISIDLIVHHAANSQ